MRSLPVPEIPVTWEDVPMLGDQLSQRYQDLLDHLQGLGDIVIAYSGGVDSSFLADAADRALGHRALAVTAVSPSLARTELVAAQELATSRGWNHRVVGTHEVSREEYSRNDSDRCYWCKTELFEVLGPIASERGATLAVGTNLDDLGDHRPGLRAATEHSVAAPLVEIGLTKADIRALSERNGLPTAEKPASPCLASRFAYGVRVTPEGLRRIESAEEFIRGLGFDVFRVRDHGELARLEVPPDRLDEAFRHREIIVGRLKELGYRFVSIDLEGFRSGAMNEVLAPSIMRRK